MQAQPAADARTATCPVGARVASQDARADECVRVDIRVTEKAIAIADDAAQRARRKTRERRAHRVHFVAEDPEVPGRDALLFARFQAQFGQFVGHRADGCGRRGHRVIRRRAAAFRYSGCILADCTPAYPTCTYPRRTTAGITLRDETSPYLLQHAANPVDWHPWGPQALELARRENKPILLSVGYSACHWCHVMAHESFEDAATAALMNELFVNIKVDREERPDLDRIYQTAHQVMNQAGGGWPLTVFLAPGSHRPFFSWHVFSAGAAPRHAGVQDGAGEKSRNFIARGRDELREHGEKLVGVLGELQPPPDTSVDGAVTRAARCSARHARAGVRQPVRRLRRSAQVSAPDESRVPAARAGASRRPPTNPTCRRCSWRR